LGGVTFDADVKEVDIDLGKGADTITLSSQVDKVILSSAFESADNISDFNGDGAAGVDIIGIDLHKGAMANGFEADNDVGANAFTASTKNHFVNT